MKFGLVFPQLEIGNDPALIKDYAQTAEALGFNHILAYDHVLGANPERPGGWQGPYTYRDSFHEVIVLFSFLAGVTEKIEFTSGILILPQRQTALVAKQAASLDVLSGGRFRMGVGIGWNPVEYTSLNEKFENRGRRIEEQVDLLRQLWAEELLNYQGTWHQVEDAGINPLPKNRTIPIWFGGHHPNVLRRVGHLGDGWMPNYRRTEDARESWEIVLKHVEEAGRDPKELGLEARMMYTAGNPDLWAERIEEWKKFGATHFSINAMGVGLDGPAKHIAILEEIAKYIEL